MSEELKLAREKAGYTIEDVAKHLKIRKKYIKDLEDNNYSEIPGKIYVEGYKKMYYDFLNIKEKYAEEATAPKTSKNKVTLETNNNFEKYIILASTIMLFLLSAVYLYIT